MSKDHLISELMGDHTERLDSFSTWFVYLIDEEDMTAEKITTDYCYFKARHMEYRVYSKIKNTIMLYRKAKKLFNNRWCPNESLYPN